MQARILWVLGCTLALVLSRSVLFFQDRNPGEYLVLPSRRKKGWGRLWVQGKGGTWTLRLRPPEVEVRDQNLQPLHLVTHLQFSPRVTNRLRWPHIPKEETESQKNSQRLKFPPGSQSSHPSRL